MARGREMSFEVDGDHAVPFLLRHVDEHPVAEDPGVVDEDVEAPERVDCGLDELAGLREVGDVRAVRDRFTAGGLDLRDDLLRGREVVALARERRRRGR